VVLVDDIRVGDRLVIKPGESVPTDGLVSEGISSVDESMLTGESLPVDKTEHSEVFAGTMNLTGRMVVQVNAIGESTALAHIIAAVQRAQNSRAEIQRLGDRVSSVFVPIIVLIAIGTALWWGLAHTQATALHEWLSQFLWPATLPSTPLAAAVISAAAVLIIACPCAMGLATPAAIMAGANAAARRGILIRDGEALEKAGNVTAAVFDKTGTLTRGVPTVVDWEMVESKSADRLDAKGIKQIAAALARHSTHPFSQAISRMSEAEVELSRSQEFSGAGVQAMMSVSASHGTREVSVRLGALRWLRKAGAGAWAGQDFVDRSSAEGASVVGFSWNEELVALFALQDEAKPGAPEVVRHLQASGVTTYLLTGDNEATARTIARQAGIPQNQINAGVRPEQKAGFVKELQDRGHRVAFIGDGINDAPALEQADLGVAVSRASDVAREAADIILLNSEIDAVPESLGLARATLRTIKQNLFWAFFYNAAAVPLAALGFLSPILCAVAMGLSDLIVIGNALRLRKWKLR
jgi:Cu+-exporting ATPase